MTDMLKKSILQSPLWAMVQKAAGRQVFFIEDAADGEQLLCSCLVIRHPLPFAKSWLYSPRPIVQNEGQWNALLTRVASIAKQKKAIFWKVDGAPLKLRTTNYKLQASQPIQPPETFILDLSLSEERLLKNMKPKTRYNIGIAEKKGVTIRWSKNAADIPLFYHLLRQTAKRQKIALHAKQHYRHIIEILGKEDAASLVIATYKNIPIAANLITFYGDTATYLHGSADHANRNLMAPYLLQWETIKEAKRLGCRYYDLGGCAVTRGKIKEWAGITRFKKGFGGVCADMGETYTVVFERVWYSLYKNAVKFKELIK